MEEELHRNYRIEGTFEIHGTASMVISAPSREEAEDLFKDYFEYCGVEYPKGDEYNYSGNTDVDIQYGTEQVWVSDYSEIPYEPSELEKLEEENAKMRSLIVDYEIKLAQKSD